MAPAKAQAATKAEPGGNYRGCQGPGAKARPTKLKPLSRVKQVRSGIGTKPKHQAALSGRLALAGSAGRTSCPTVPRSVALWSHVLHTCVEVRPQGARGQLNEDP